MFGSLDEAVDTVITGMFFLAYILYVPIAVLLFVSGFF